MWIRAQLCEAVGVPERLWTEISPWHLITTLAQVCSRQAAGRAPEVQCAPLLATVDELRRLVPNVWVSGGGDQEIIIKAADVAALHDHLAGEDVCAIQVCNVNAKKYRFV